MGAQGEGSHSFSNWWHTPRCTTGSLRNFRWALRLLGLLYVFSTYWFWQLAKNKVVIACVSDVCLCVDMYVNHRHCGKNNLPTVNVFPNKGRSTVSDVAVIEVNDYWYTQCDEANIENFHCMCIFPTKMPSHGGNYVLCWRGIPVWGCRCDLILFDASEIYVYE